MSRVIPEDVIELSIVAPFYNEEEMIGAFFDRLDQVLPPGSIRVEYVCVNDGSSDRTLELLRERASRDSRIRILNLSRNFGKDIALTAGLDHAKGEAVVPIDSDLQDPPELIHEMLRLWREGFDVVYAQRECRKSDGMVKRSFARGFYTVFNWLSPTRIPFDTGDFRLMDARVVHVVRQLREQNRFMKGLFAWVGFRQTHVSFQRPERLGGSSSWSLWKLWNFALDGITSFSTFPLRIWTYLGIGLSFLSILYAGFLIFRTILFGIEVPGYASLMVVILTFVAFQLISLGIIGEYIGRIYLEVKLRPLYIVDDSKADHSPEIVTPETPKDELF